MINQFLAMHPDELEKNTKKIIGKFPNTYVFTKGLVERILKKRRSNNILYEYLYFDTILTFIYND